MKNKPIKDDVPCILSTANLTTSEHNEINSIIEDRSSMIDVEDIRKERIIDAAIDVYNGNYKSYDDYCNRATSKPNIISDYIFNHIIKMKEGKNND